MLSPSTRRWHGWRHPMFWKMLGADCLLVGLAVVVYPVRMGTRLVLAVVALLLVSVVLNAALTPHLRLPGHSPVPPR